MLGVKKAKFQKQSRGEYPEYPPGEIVIPCNDLARYHNFTYDFRLLDVPDGTVISMTRSASVVENLNLAIRSLNNNSEWVWIMGDDHAFGRDTLMKLLKVLYENDYSIVVPLCCRRGPPFGLVVFDEERDEDYLGRGQFHTMQFPDLPKSGQFECIAAGSAGMLINRGVFDEMGEPWFENSDNITTNEDVVFCKKARALGHKVMVDVDTRIGHIGVVGVWPDYRDGQWGITLDFQGVGQNHIFLAGGIREGNNGAPEPRTGTLDWE